MAKGPALSGVCFPSSCGSLCSSRRPLLAVSRGPGVADEDAMLRKRHSSPRQSAAAVP